MDSAAEKVLHEVTEAIASDDRFTPTFEPLAEGMHQEHGFWMVPVRLRRFEPASKRLELYARFAELESFLQSEKKMNVILLPVITAMTA